jgi:2-keto-3-deoxy-L-fuconate dehydrogenase
VQLFSLAGKTAIVTGGGSGIGRAISQVFGGMGASVHILERDIDNAEIVKEIIVNQGGKAFANQCDVSLSKEVNQTVKRISDHGRIDILVNNAGVSHVGNVENTEEADFDRIFSINVKGIYNCLHACIPIMKRQAGGVILNMASTVSSVGIPDRFAYSMSKGAVLTMTYSVAADYLEHHIRCNCISPARVHTPFVDGFIAKNYPGREKEMFEKLSRAQPIGRMAKPEEIAYLALYLCSDEAAFITGSDFPIDGGFIKLIL